MKQSNILCINQSSKRVSRAITIINNNSVIALTVFNSVHSSSVGLRVTNKIKAITILHTDLYNMLIGLLLGDGSLQMGKQSKNPRFIHGQGIGKLAYSWYIFNLLSHYCQSVPVQFKSTSGGSINWSQSVVTRSYPSLFLLYEQFYSNGKKVVPKNITEMVTPEGLAF
jgi:hypothetical protein